MEVPPFVACLYRIARPADDNVKQLLDHDDSWVWKEWNINLFTFVEATFLSDQFIHLRPLTIKTNLMDWKIWPNIFRLEK